MRLAVAEAIQLLALCGAAIHLGFQECLGTLRPERQGQCGPVWGRLLGRSSSSLCLWVHSVLFLEAV